MRAPLLATSIAFAAASLATGAAALEFSLHANNKDSLLAILAEGEILPGDADRLAVFLSGQADGSRQRRRSIMMQISADRIAVQNIRIILLLKIYETSRKTVAIYPSAQYQGR